MSKDLIDRQAAIDALKQCTMHCVTTDSYHIDADDAMHRISVLLSAQSDNSNESEPPHSCKTCKYNALHWYEEPCDSCTGDSWRPYGGDQNG